MPEKSGNQSQPPPSRYAKILAQKLLDGQLVLFVGAGLSHLAPAKDGSDRRLPLWKGLTEQVAQTCHEDPALYQGNPLDLFDAVVFNQSRFVLEQAVRDALDDKAFDLSPAHHALAELPWAAIFTTNYDSLLQRLLGEEPVYEEQDYDRLSLPEAKRPRLFQIHGTLSRPHTLTREDYRLWAEKHQRAYRHLEQLVLEKTVLFVGYSMSDPHLDSLLATVRKITQGRERRMYAWMWRVPENMMRLLERRDKIEAISIEQEEDWAFAFRQLKACLDELRPPVTVAPAGPQPPPQEATGARLQFIKGSPVSLTRLFACLRIAMGRPKLTADLWLALYPLDDPSNQTLMDGMGESHAALLLEKQVKIRDNHSKGGTEINGTPITWNWQILQDGDVIGFCHGILQLRVHTEPGQWLRLDRINNGPNVENYLFLQDSAAIGAGEGAAIPVGEGASSEGRLAGLRYGQDGFMIAGQAAQIVINGRPLPSGMAAGLKDGDWVEVGPVLFEFRTGAYPGG